MVPGSHFVLEILEFFFSDFLENFQSFIADSGKTKMVSKSNVTYNIF